MKEIVEKIQKEYEEFAVNAEAQVKKGNKAAGARARKAALALNNLCEQAGATVQGIGIVIEKGFQPGGKLLREINNIRVESLAIIDNIDNGVITFRD